MSSLSREEVLGCILLCVLFFWAVRRVLAWCQLSYQQINCVMCLVHHVCVTFFCLCCNFSFMTLLQSSFETSLLPCEARLYSNNNIVISGIFTIIYLIFDTVYDLIPNFSKNKLLIFHHFNGIFLVSYGLFSHYGEYMVYICHLMEISSIFLSLKELLKSTDKVPEWLKLVNDLLFVVSFLVVRSYTTLASVFMFLGMYRNDCFETFTFLDYLNIYTTTLYCVLTTFWSYGILKKVYGLITGSSSSKSKKKE